MDVADFDYELPSQAIAQEPVEPRDASRLLIARTLEELPFTSFPSLLDPGDLLVVNRTRVRHARLEARRADTGGAVEVLLIRQLAGGEWEALMRPARRIRAGVDLTIGDRTIEVRSNPVDGVATVALRPDDDVEAFLDAHGSVPLPPYFRGELQDPDRYQTIFASDPGSAAAPTAALHFTPRVLEGIHARDVRVSSVTLEIGLDTFRPMASGSVRDHQIHTERIIVDEQVADAIAQTKARGNRVVAVGTTVVRTLESAADESGVVLPYDGPTSLFILPGYRPRVVDALLTNFHAPRTTLIALVAALAGDRWRDIYRHALDEGFRFLSFGDALYIEVSP
ncbi:MAG: tRNA preQ1(34) S-adenosylmethionine ribosyltransferase-isomerase QueA [Acidimicrobiia bacterium]|nr:tRNA preQ1(34) S-adenosylmethionine ribosyltransferase-isomerase QueA [Acidimicrobiia bacterium]